MRLDSPEGSHHYVEVDWSPKPKGSVSEAEAREVSKREASSTLFIARE